MRHLEAGKALPSETTTTTDAERLVHLSIFPRLNAAIDKRRTPQKDSAKPGHKLNHARPESTADPDADRAQRDTARDTVLPSATRPESRRDRRKVQPTSSRNRCLGDSGGRTS